MFKTNKNIHNKIVSIIILVPSPLFFIWAHWHFNWAKVISFGGKKNISIGRRFFYISYINWVKIFSYIIFRLGE